MRFVLSFLGDCGIVLGLIGAGVDAGEHVALLHVLSLGEVDLEKLAAHLRVHGDGVQRLTRADGVEHHRHVAGLHLRDDDRDWRLGARARTAARPPRATGLLLPRLGSADGGDVNPAGPVRVPSARRDHDQKEKELLHGFS